jgi:hypothetical protein
MQIKNCTKCGESHDIAQFRYLATLAQTKKWGKAGNVRMEVESKYCKNCRPKRKPPSQLSAKEIHNRVQSGDMSEYTAKMLRAKLARDERNKQAMAARKRWEKVWSAELKEVLKPIAKEIISARNTWHYARDKGYVDKAVFYHEYMGLLIHEKTHADMNYAIKPRRPSSSRWADYIHPNVFTRVREMWALLPPSFKHSHIPLLIKYRPDGAQLADSLSATTQGESK